MSQEVDGENARRDSRPGLTVAVATLIGVYGFFDALIKALPIAVLAAVLNAIFVFVVAAVLLTLLNVACSHWIERQWDIWIAGNSRRLESRLEKMRKGA